LRSLRASLAVAAAAFDETASMFEAASVSNYIELQVLMVFMPVSASVLVL
jgi:hypothetical protein